MAVPETFGSGSSPSIVEGHNAGGQKCRIEPVADQICADGGHHQPHAVDGLAAGLGNGGNGERGGNGDKAPNEASEQAEHATKNTEAAVVMPTALILRLFTDVALSENSAPAKSKP